jgi:hypothetical protein
MLFRPARIADILTQVKILALNIGLMSLVIQFLSFGAGLIVAGLGMIAAVYLASAPPRQQDSD